MTIGKFFYYILIGPALLATFVYHVFYMIVLLMEFGKDAMEELLEEIKEF
jgi:hypothetical protein